MPSRRPGSRSPRLPPPFAARSQALRDAVGAQFQFWRGARPIADVARQAGVAPWRVARIEAGDLSTATWRDLDRLATALGQSVEALVLEIVTASTQTRH